MPQLSTGNDRERLVRLLLDTPFGVDYVPSHPNDFGDQTTVRVMLKRQKSNVDLKFETDFGIYLGKHADGFYVAIRNEQGEAQSYERFETLELLKQEWQLD